MSSNKVKGIMCIISSEYAPRIAASISACKLMPFLVYRTVILSSPCPVTDEPSSAFAHMRAFSLPNVILSPSLTVGPYVPRTRKRRTRRKGE